MLRAAGSLRNAHDQRSVGAGSIHVDYKKNTGAEVVALLSTGLFSSKFTIAFFSPKSFPVCSSPFPVYNSTIMVFRIKMPKLFRSAIKQETLYPGFCLQP